MTLQTSMDFTGKENRDRGIAQALHNANATEPGWEDKALDFLHGYAQINGRFMVEDVRYASQGFVPPAPSARSWGAIILKALKNGWVWKKTGEIEKVKNSKAHRANAQVWRSNILKY